MLPLPSWRNRTFYKEPTLPSVCIHTTLNVPDLPRILLPPQMPWITLRNKTRLVLCEHLFSLLTLPGFSLRDLIFLFFAHKQKLAEMSPQWCFRPKRLTSAFAYMAYWYTCKNLHNKKKKESRYRMVLWLTVGAFIRV